MGKQWDMALLGPVSKDFNIEPDGVENIEIGGAIMYSPFAAAAAGADCIALVKGNIETELLNRSYEGFAGELVNIKGSAMTSIENRYLDSSHEERISRMKSQADPFTAEDLAGIDAQIYHLGGLIYGDFSDDFILEVAKRGDAALDAQCLLRHGNRETGEMTYADWPGKTTVLPHVRYLKVDAKEARILTGLEDRQASARQLHAYGAKEIFISFHNQMMVFDGEHFYTCDYEQTNLIGRTGRGDTVFAAYLARRLHHDIESSLRFATSLVMMKMCARGPFRQTAGAVEQHAAKKGLSVMVQQA